MTSGGPAGRIDTYRLARMAVARRIEAACRRAGRDPDTVTLVAVSKTVDAESLRDAVAAGLDLLGENRVQEAAVKVPLVPGARWHLVGPLQSNKARHALELFDAIESVDSVSLAERLGRLAHDVRPGIRYPILLQVNVDADPAKAGLDPTVLEATVARIAALEALEIRGLMTIGRLVSDPEAARPTFRRLRALSTELRAGRAADRTGAVDGHDRRLRGGGGGGSDDRPRRPGPVRGAPSPGLTGGCGLPALPNVPPSTGWLQPIPALLVRATVPRPLPSVRPIRLALPTNRRPDGRRFQPHQCVATVGDPYTNLTGTPRRRTAVLRRAAVDSRAWVVPSFSTSSSCC